MRNHYLAVGAIGVLSLILLVVGFTIAGSPISQRLVALDATRLQHFSTIQSGIEEYYRTNAALPESLSAVSSIAIPRDPETQKEYEYTKTGSTSYNLCTTFSTDTRKTLQSDPNYTYAPGRVNPNHNAGYDCIAHTIPDYINTKNAPVEMTR